MTSSRPPSVPAVDAATAGSHAGSLVGIYELLVATDEFEAFLCDLASLARDAIPGDLSCGVTVLRDGRYVTAGSSDRRALVLDEAQYDVGYGPCLHALETSTEVYVPDLTADARWPQYSMRAKAHGLRSSLSVPLLVDDSAAGALNLYRFDEGGISQPQRAIARRFAEKASRAMLLAIRQARQQQVNEELHNAMGSRRVIDQAIGVIMAQNRCTVEEAFDVLKRASQHRNIKLRQVAADVVTSVTGQAPSTDAGFRR